MTEVPKTLSPTIFDWQSPESYVSPQVAHDYLRFQEVPPQPEGILDALKNKWVIIGAAGALALGLTIASTDKTTLGGAIRDIFPDDSPPITHPVNKIVDNHG